MASAASTSSPLSLPALPWAENALEPVISAKTISFHYGKHHKTYVENANKLIAGTELADLPLDQIVTRDRRPGGTGGHLQQRGADLESRLLLEQPQAQGRRRAAGCAEG